MKELAPKQIFLNEIKKKISTGKWDLEDIESLENNHVKYHLNYNDIGLLLVDVYRYVYSMVYEDGHLSQLELENLKQFNTLILTNNYPSTRVHREDLKFRIRSLVKVFEVNNVLEEDLILKQGLEERAALINNRELESENKLKEENRKKDFKKIFYWTRPKLTPYS